jgi:hypothetical protein
MTNAAHIDAQPGSEPLVSTDHTPALDRSLAALERWLDRRTALERAHLDEVMSHPLIERADDTECHSGEAWWRSWRACKKQRPIA